MRCTHKNPVKNLKIKNDQKFVDNEDRAEHMKEMNNVVLITFRRPVVSARYPHKCDDKMIPSK